MLKADDVLKMIKIQTSMILGGTYMKKELTDVIKTFENSLLVKSTKHALIELHCLHSFGLMAENFQLSAVAGVEIGIEDMLLNMLTSNIKMKINAGSQMQFYMKT